MLRAPAAAIAFACALAASACANHAFPLDRRVEATFPDAAPVTSLPKDLRVVTFNVHMEAGPVILRGIESDPRLRTADLILLEEVHRDEATLESCSGACYVGRALGYHTLYAPGHSHGTGTDGVAILSRAPILSAEVIELPFFDVHVNSGRRIALAATVLVDGTPTTIYAVHLENRVSVNDRKAQMIPVLEHAQRQHTPVIIAGDFNTSPFTWVAHLLPIPTGTQDDRLEALMRAHGFATPVTRSGPTSRFLRMKLDAIYTRGFDTLAFATARARNVSDHLALWATLRARSRTMISAL